MDHFTSGEIKCMANSPCQLATEWQLRPKLLTSSSFPYGHFQVSLGAWTYLLVSKATQEMHHLHSVKAQNTRHKVDRAVITLLRFFLIKMLHSRDHSLQGKQPLKCFLPNNP